MPAALTNRIPVTDDALPWATRFHAAAGRERHLFGEPSPPWWSAPFGINILLSTTEIKQFIPFFPPCNCSDELKITFCVRGAISRLLSNLYLNEVDRMLERAKAVTRYERWTAVEYARFADDRAPRAQRAEEGPMCVTAGSMRVGPSEPAGRSRFQTTFGGCGQKPWS